MPIYREIGLRCCSCAAVVALSIGGVWVTHPGQIGPASGMRPSTEQYHGMSAEQRCGSANEQYHGGARLV
jgi:hypothetical protein